MAHAGKSSGSAPAATTSAAASVLSSSPLSSSSAAAAAAGASTISANETWTFTFSESVENHAGMQILGERAPAGFSIDELKACAEKAANLGYVTETVDLEPLLSGENKAEKSTQPQTQQTQHAARVLIIRNYLTKTLGADGASKMTQETNALKKMVDKKAFMYGRVVNKTARWNLCFDDKSQEPDYENKKGRVVSFGDLPCLSQIREHLPKLLGDTKAKQLKAELNYYYDTLKCGIGWHGDTERRIVIGLRVGATMPLYYQWFSQGKPIGARAALTLNHGDLYIMSDKAVGHDWRTKNMLTLRHCAGADKFTRLPTEAKLDAQKKNKRKRVSNS